MSELTFDFDKLNRAELANRLTKAISTFHPFADGAYVLSLNARYGSGKTTFLQMWKSDLISQGYNVIYIDAWKTDFDEDPIIPITSHIIENIKTETGSAKARSALHGLIGAAALSGNQIIKSVTGLDIHETMNAVQNDLEQNDIIKIGEILYKQYDFKLKAYEGIKQELSRYIESLEKTPLIILVDELDRVRPDYSIKFLEAIKHIFSLEKLCFVLAVDEKQLENSVKQLYGNIDFKNYYARFVSRQINLNFSGLNNNIHDYMRVVYSEFKKKIEFASLPLCISKDDEGKLIQSMIHICVQLKLTPRQVRHAINSLFHIITIERQTNANWIEAAFFLICLKIQSTEEIYINTATGKISPKEIFNYIRNLNQSSEDALRSVLWTVYAFLLKESNKREINEILNEINQSRNYDFLHELSRSVNNFRSINNEAAFIQIYNILEEWRTFIE